MRNYYYYYLLDKSDLFLFLSTGQEASASPLCGRKCTIAAEGNKVPATPPSPRNLLPYGHRKCHSLGYKSVFLLVDDEDDDLLYVPVLSFKVFLFPSLCDLCPRSFIHKMNTVEFKSATFPNAGSRHLLDDSVMESHSPTRGQAESSTLSSGISLGETRACLSQCWFPSKTCCLFSGYGFCLCTGSSEGSELSEEVSWPAFER